MELYNNILFFDKNGQSHNFKFNNTEKYWEGTIFIPKVSINLFEVEKLIIVEKQQYKNEYRYGYPHKFDNSISNKIKFSLDDTESEEIFLYDTILENDVLLFNKLDIIEKDLIEDNSETIINGIKQVYNYSNNSINVDIGIKSYLEGSFENILIITTFINNKEIIIAKITIYGEIEGEDERLKILSNNLGYDFLFDDKVFKHSDNSEDYIDFVLLNKKRKLLLLEGHNIIPYIGSYKGIFGAIKFYGYSNLKIKEYWKNVDELSPTFGGYITGKVLDIKNNTITFDNKISIPNKKFKKTNSLGLFYRLNKISEEYIDNLPLTDDIADYTYDEILTKINNLKNELKNNFLPLNLRIKDITGEADFFTSHRLSVLPMNDKTDIINLGKSPSFSVLPSTYGYIQDLRNIDSIQWPELENPPIPRNFNNLLNSSFTINDLTDILLAYFENYSKSNNLVKVLPDTENVPAGYPIILSCDSFDLTWKDLNCTWKDLITDSDLYTWNNLKYGNFYNLKWIITGPNSYLYEVEGNLDVFKKHPVNLPYTGSYDVELILTDLFNIKSKFKKENYITVDSYNANFTGYYKKELEQPYNTINDLKMTWSDLNYANNLPNRTDEDTFVRNFQNNGNISIEGAIKWSNFDNVKWSALSNRKWSELIHSGNTPSNFIINEVEINKSLTITLSNGYTSSHTFSSNDLSTSLDELNNETSNVFTKFSYHPIYDNDYLVITKILCLCKFYSKDFNISEITSNGNIGFTYNNAVLNNPAWNNIRILTNGKILDKYSYITFVPSDCKIPGKNNYIWTIKNISNNTIFNYNGRQFGYLFKESGNYTISLSINDTNNNIKEINKNLVIIK